MCPLCYILPVLFIIGISHAVNWFLRRKRIKLGDKAVFISGCDRGFGETLALRLAMEGFTVYAGCLDLNSHGACRLRKYSTVSVINVDITSDVSVSQASKFIDTQRKAKGLWAVVNNAGIAVFAESEWCTMEAYERVLGVNLMGTIRVTKAMLPMVRRAQGRVINMSSLAGRCALPGFTAYSASKFGVIGFSDSLRRELWKFNVKVITVEPKLYRTSIADPDFHIADNQRMWKETSEKVRLDYGNTYFSAFLSQMLQNVKMSSRKIYQVIDDLEHAVMAQYPYTRYVPGRKIQILSDLFICHPNCIQDHLITNKLAVRCVPFAMQKEKTV